MLDEKDYAKEIRLFKIYDLLLECVSKLKRMK